MSNAKHTLVGILAMTCSGAMTSCSVLPGHHDPDRPYRKEAERVVAAVELHAPLGWRCRRVAAVIVEAGITARMAATAGEVRHAALVASLAGADWDALECPAAAVPGLSFGTSDMAVQIANGAPKAAGLL